VKLRSEPPTEEPVLGRQARRYDEHWRAFWLPVVGVIGVVVVLVFVVGSAARRVALPREVVVAVLTAIITLSAGAAGHAAGHAARGSEPTRDDRDDETG
jgi:hypothetical protein